MISSKHHKQIIINRLNELGLDGETFCHQLAKFKCLMAGSFPLQCLLGETYENSDIDIFVSHEIKYDNGIAVRHRCEFEK